MYFPAAWQTSQESRFTRACSPRVRRKGGIFPPWMSWHVVQINWPALAPSLPRRNPGPGEAIGTSEGCAHRTEWHVRHLADRKSSLKENSSPTFGGGGDVSFAGGIMWQAQGGKLRLTSCGGPGVKGLSGTPARPGKGPHRTQRMIGGPKKASIVVISFRLQGVPLEFNAFIPSPAGLAKPRSEGLFRHSPGMIYCRIRELKTKIETRFDYMPPSAGLHRSPWSLRLFPLGIFFFRCITKRALHSSRPLCFGDRIESRRGRVAADSIRGGTARAGPILDSIWFRMSMSAEWLILG